MLETLAKMETKKYINQQLQGSASIIKKVIGNSH